MPSDKSKKSTRDKRFQLKIKTKRTISISGKKQDQKELKGLK